MVARASTLAFATSAMIACTSFDEPIAALDGGAVTDAASPDAGGSSSGDAQATTDARATTDAALDPSARYEALVKRDDPSSYWRFAEGSGTKATSIAGDGVVLVVQANGPAFDATGIFGSNSRSMLFTAATTTALAEDSGGQSVKQVGPSTFALEVWIEAPPPDGVVRWIIHQTGSSSSYGIFIDATGFGARVIGITGSVEGTSTSAPIGAGWHHLVLNRDNVAFILWVDGQKYPGADAGNSPMSFTRGFSVGGETQSAKLLGAGTRIAEVAVYDHDLSDLQIAEHYAAGRP